MPTSRTPVAWSSTAANASRRPWPRLASTSCLPARTSCLRGIRHTTGQGSSRHCARGASSCATSRNLVSTSSCASRSGPTRNATSWSRHCGKSSRREVLRGGKPSPRPHPRCARPLPAGEAKIRRASASPRVEVLGPSAPLYRARKGPDLLLPSPACGRGVGGEGCVSAAPRQSARLTRAACGASIHRDLVARQRHCLHLEGNTVEQRDQARALRRRTGRIDPRRRRGTRV